MLGIEGTLREHGITKRHVAYAITSLPPADADVAMLPRLKRGHWRIETRLHGCKNVTLDEETPV